MELRIVGSINGRNRNAFGAYGFYLGGGGRGQCWVLREDHAIYLIGTERANLAGLNVANIDALVSGLARVLTSETARRWTLQHDR